MDPTPIPVRRPALSFDAKMQRFYLGGNPIRTHFFNALNLAFPDGERFFVRSVRDHLDSIDDPALLADIRGFCGQEGQHARQHERFFVVLEEQGYDVDRILRPFRKLARWASRWLPRSLRLSMTAGAEHYTATMASLVLQEGMLDGCEPSVRELIEWHAIEEIEHKHVAYDVLCSVYPHNYPLRILGFVVASTVIAVLALLGLRMLLRQDGSARRLDREGYQRARAHVATGRDAQFRDELRRSLRLYFRPGFHPNQQDDRPLLDRVRPRIDARLVAAG